MNRALVFPTLLAIVLCGSAFGSGPIINEFMASNGSTLADEDGDFPDWIEIYNPTAEPINLGDWYLTDDEDDLVMWRFPSVTIPADGYLVVFASGKDRAFAGSQLHTNFSLSIDGEYLALVAPDGETIVQEFAPHFPPQMRDVSYGMGELGCYTYFHAPTPGGPNVLELQPGWATGPVISEFMASNGITLADEDGDFADWIEIHNPTDSPVNLSGWYLTDDADDLVMWRFPSVTVPAGGYLVVFASGKDRAFGGSQLHTNFSLSSSGEYLALVEPDGITIAHEFLPEFPPQFRDVSYGLFGAELRYFTDPTPGVGNIGGLAGFVEEVSFSVPHGIFYDLSEAFALELSTPTPGATIWYTVNGDDPIDPDSTRQAYAGPITIDRTRVIRAAATNSGHFDSPVSTQTYIFLDSVLTQSNDQSELGYPDIWYNTRGGSAWSNPEWFSRPGFYAVHPDVELTKEDLLSIPTMALTLTGHDLFDPSEGIYVNPIQRARNNPMWEKPASLELIYPDGAEGFAVNAGARISGELARWVICNAKFGFRILFKSEYGANRLETDLFPDCQIGRYNTIILRSVWGESWLHDETLGDQYPGIPTFTYGSPVRRTYLKDQVGHDIFYATGQVGVQGRFVHLYLNGLYWGLYQVIERPDDAFNAEHFGGEREQWDIIKGAVGNTEWNGRLHGGTRDAWDYLFSFFDFDGTRNTTNVTPISDADYEIIKQYLDVENFADMMLTLIYIGRYDFPRKNWYAAGLPGGSGEPMVVPFRFYVWDSEASLSSLSANRTGLGNSASDDTGPGRLYRRLRMNKQFQMLFADRVQKHLFNGGCMTPEGAGAIFQARVDEVYDAIVGESARWGHFAANRRDNPLLRDVEWIAEINWLTNTYFPQRTARVLSQLRQVNLYPSIDPPVFSHGGGAYEPETLLTITNPNSGGTVWITLDGTDPRRSISAISLSSFTLQGVMHVRASVRQDNEWSTLTEGTFMPAGGPTLAVTEIMYNPPEEEDRAYSTQEYEFIEIQNTGDASVSLEPIAFVEGIRFDFADGDILSLAPGEYAVVVRNLDAFIERYGPGLPVAGVYSGRLSNSGERIALAASGMEFGSFTYEDGGDWPWLADGFGASLQRVDTAMDPNDPAAWRASSEYLGAPGAPGAGPIRDIVDNEVLAHTRTPVVDAIELYNAGGTTIDVGGWYLSDRSDTFRMFRIPDGTVMAPDTYLVFDEDDFNVGETGFALSRFGEEVWVMAGDVDGNLTRFVDHVQFGASFDGMTFGRYPNGSGELTAMAENTLGYANSGPRVSPVVISEIYYHPAEVAGVDEADLEFLKLHNHTDSEIPLDWYDANDDGVVDPDEGGWALTRGVRFDFPVGTSIPAGCSLLVVGFDPMDAAKLDAFCAVYDIPPLTPGVDVVGPWEGRLSNSGERVRLAAADASRDDDDPPMVAMDEVRYGVTAPWPEEAGGYGASLHRVAPSAFGNFADSWIAAAPSPGDLGDIGLIPGDINGDGRVDLDDFVILKQNFGRTDATRAEGDLNGDGIVDMEDFMILKQNFGMW